MDFAKSDRSTVRRLPKRAAYDRETIYAILDEGLVAHVGFVVDGAPVVIPMNYGRSGDVIYLHGSAASRLMKSLAAGIESCVTVTLLDGLVLARSAFHHSMNYRSVVVFGTAHAVNDTNEKNAALRVISEHIIPGRWDAVRPPSAEELAATTVLALSIREASAKVRSGPPGDDEADYAIPVWAGVIPTRLASGDPIADDRTMLPAPGHVTNFRRGG